MEISTAARIAALEATVAVLAAELEIIRLQRREVTAAPILTLRQAARMAGVSERTVERARSAGLLAALAMPGSGKRPMWRFERAAIELWMRGRTAGRNV